MKNPVSSPLVIFAERHRLRLYSAKLPAILTWDYPPTVIADLDIKNVESLRREIKLLVERGKITPTPILLIFSPTACFERSFPETDPSHKQEEIQKFIDAVPFEYVRSKIITVGKGSRVVVANRDFYEALDIAFERLGFTTLAIAPFTLLGLPLPQSGFDASVGKLISQKIDLARQQSFYTPRATNQENQVSAKSDEKRRLAILGAIFVALLVILMIVFFISQRNSPQTPASPATKPTNPAPAASPANQSSKTPEATASGTADLTLYRIEILNGSKTAGLAEEIRKQLQNLGFKDVATGNTAGAASTKTIIVYRSGVPDSVVDLIVNELQNTFSDISAREVPGATIDVSITTGTGKVQNP